MLGMRIAKAILSVAMAAEIVLLPALTACTQSQQSKTTPDAVTASDIISRSNPGLEDVIIGGGVSGFYAQNSTGVQGVGTVAADTLIFWPHITVDPSYSKWDGWVTLVFLDAYDNFIFGHTAYYSGQSESKPIVFEHWSSEAKMAQSEPARCEAYVAILNIGNTSNTSITTLGINREDMDELIFNQAGYEALRQVGCELSMLGNDALRDWANTSSGAAATSGKSSSSSSAASKTPSASSNSGDYVLADSATRAYSKSELEKMSTYDLFLARNEIYARHGRIFQKEELRDYFGSKSWYHGTIEPSDFTDSMLNDTERANANAMLEIEKSRNSPYLS